jgi:Protein of unknown function (DUF2911)
MRNGLFLALLAMVALPLGAQQTGMPAAPQVRYPALSQHATVTQTVGLTDITITFSRPGVKGRQIWGGLVPYGQPWRTGANEATTISFSDDVTVNGQSLAKGTYAFFAVPTQNDWTLIFNSVSKQWGAYSYDASKDALKVTSTPAHAAFTEWLTYEFPSVSTDAATVQLRWENLAVPFTVNTGTTAKVMSNARDAVAKAAADDWQTPYRAANFAFNSDMKDDAGKWIDTSMKAKATPSNLYLKARMQAKAGDRAGAISTAQQALKLTTDKDKELAGEINASIAEWGK